MAWWNPLSWGSSGKPIPADPDLSEFERATWAVGTLGAQGLIHLGAYGMGCRADTDPMQVSDLVLDAIGCHPVVSTGESVVCGPATDPELYFIRRGRGATDQHVSEVEAWLRPLLTMQRAPLLEQIARAFAYGTVAVVLDLGVQDLAIRVLSEVQETDPVTGKTVTRKQDRGRNLPWHVHYVASHELWPGDTTIFVEHDKLLGVSEVLSGAQYGGEDLDTPGLRRAFLSMWQPQFGRWRSPGSRHRAYRDWFEEGHTRTWEMRMVERNVDLARVGYAPDGEITLGGQKVSSAKLLRAQIAGLRNGSTIVLPSSYDSNGNRLWEVKTLDGGENRHQVFGTVMDARAMRMLWACMIPGGKPDKATEEMVMDSVQRVCDFTARTLTRIVNRCLAITYGDGKVMLEVLANDVPKRKLRLVQQVFSTVADATQRLPDGRVYTLAELVDPEIVAQLGIKMRSVDEAAHEPAAAPAPGGPPGAPLDVASSREERRDDADTIEGEEDTGGKDMEREERDQ